MPPYFVIDLSTNMAQNVLTKTLKSIKRVGSIQKIQKALSFLILNELRLNFLQKINADN
jgi:hypothetical protein